MIGQQYPSFQFTRESILANALETSGVYAIFRPSAWIYVGEGHDMRARLLAHVNGDNPCIIRENPTGFQCEACPASQRVARQDQLILALGPLCNQRLS